MLMSGLMTGCSSTAPAGTESKPKASTSKKIKMKDVNIAVILKAQNASYWDYVKKGAQDAADELGIKVYYDAPELESMPEKQVDMINEAVTNKASAIVIAPIDWQQGSPLREAEAAGVPVVVIDSECSNYDEKCYIATNSEEAGHMAGREAINILNNDEDGPGGTCAIIAHTLGTDTAGARFCGFMDELDSYNNTLAQYSSEKDLKTVDICGSEFCDSDYDNAKERTKFVLDHNPGVDLLYCTNETVSRGAVDAVKEMGLAGKIRIIGFDSSDDLIAAVNDGTMDGFLVQNPYQMGYMGVTNAVAMLKGEEVDPAIDTRVTYITKENINNNDVQHILNPLS